MQGREHGSNAGTHSRLTVPMPMAIPLDVLGPDRVVRKRTSSNVLAQRPTGWGPEEPEGRRQGEMEDTGREDEEQGHQDHGKMDNIGKYASRVGYADPQGGIPRRQGRGEEKGSFALSASGTDMGEGDRVALRVEHGSLTLAGEHEKALESDDGGDGEHVYGRGGQRTLRDDGAAAANRLYQKNGPYVDEHKLDHDHDHDNDSEHRALLADHSYPPENEGDVRHGIHVGHTRSETSDDLATHRTPLPYAKILPLAISRISEGLIFSVILPYINEMIHGLGVPEQEVGVWSATAESSLMVAEALTAPFFGPVADRYGRRPVFLACVGLWGLGAIAFGLVRSVWTVILTRAFLGVLSGAGVLSRTMLGELCDRTNRVQGFAIFTPAFTIGSTLGPVIGGTLSNPVPRVLSEWWTVFVEYPYLLPSILVGSSGILAYILGLFLLPETLPPSLRRGAARVAQDPISDEATDSVKNIEARPSMGSLLRHRPFQHILILYGLCNGLQFCFEALFPLFAFTARELGGLGMQIPTIGFILSLSALLSIVMTVFLFPFLHRSMSEQWFLLLCLVSYPIAALILPMVWASHYAAEDGSLSLYSVMLLVTHVILRRVGDFACTLFDTMTFDAIPRPEYLALANSALFCMAAVGRALGPFIISYFFSVSTHYDKSSPLRQLVWAVFLLLNTPGLYCWWQMRKSSMEGDRSGRARARASEDVEREELVSRP